jgi:ribosomal protein S18 acetylase RimI-like enzyme
LFIALDNNKIVGFVRLRETDEVQDYLGDNVVELQRLYILTQAQGKSIGDKLMNRAFAYATEQKYNWMWLGVWEHNLGAQKFYMKYGFEKFSEHTFWMGDDPQVDWLLKKKL